jgi:hypothetical protein
VYKAQAGLKQSYNCQKFGHVWTNCKQPPRCMWCRGGNLHTECAEKDSAASIPTCCNCKLVGGGDPHPSNYRGCSHARNETRKGISQSSEGYIGKGVFFQLHSPWTVLFGDSAQEYTATAAASAAPACTGLPRHPWAKTSKYQASQFRLNVNSSSLNGIFK